MSFFAVLRLGFVALFLLLVMPTFVSAGLFPKSSLVKMIDAKGFREIMKLNVSNTRFSISMPQFIVGFLLSLVFLCLCSFNPSIFSPPPCFAFDPLISR